MKKILYLFFKTTDFILQKYYFFQSFFYFYTPIRGFHMLQFFKNDNLAIIRLLAFIAFFSSMLMTWSLWFSERTFPLVSLFDGIPAPNRNIDVVLIGVFISFFLLFIIKSKWSVGTPIILIYMYWSLLDQNRLQHFFFEIIFVVFALSIFNHKTITAKKCLLWIFIGTYFWSGMHKYNEVFFNKWLNGLNKRIPFVPYWMRVCFTYAVPFLEAGFGLMLLFVKTRKIGIWLIAIMHLIILITFLKGGFGYAVIPLMVFNVLTLFLVFYKSKITTKQLFTIDSPKIIAIYLITVLLPLSNLFGFYDHILAFSYFSGKPKYGRIHFNNKFETEQLPSHIKNIVREYNGEYYIDLNEWSAYTIKVMVYPEMRVYHKLKAYIDEHLEDPNTHLEFY